MSRNRDLRGDTKPLPLSFGRVLGQPSASFFLDVLFAGASSSRTSDPKVGYNTGPATVDFQRRMGHRLRQACLTKLC
jgi:hypothetical protein